MEAVRRELVRMRESPALWRELRYERARDGDGYVCDRNVARRAKVLWALQYDHRPEDVALVRWLAEQEACCRREAPFQGLSEETRLAGFLLADYRQVADVWLHWEIKRANFDTWAGYDLEHLFAAGVGETVAFVRESGHADRDAVLGLLLDEQGRARVSAEELAQWRQSQRSSFPVDPAGEDPLTWVERAKLVGDRGLARRELDRWMGGQARDDATLSVLCHQLAALGAYAEAAQAQRERLVYADSPWDSASAYRSLAGLERQAGDHRAARDALRLCRRALDGVPGWSMVGLGRMYVEELFLLAGAAEGALAEAVFAEADHQAREVPGLPMVVLRAAAEAAGKIGDETNAERYQQLCDAERARIDTAVAQARGHRDTPRS
ncbi:hypothetical protein DFR70_12217 [Nocardia tenerifensis]|uniref:Uncharacterized protein n=2 Tax=Nocardia tenerifensis TaxID=228006 RepID=A0A318JNA2_9NOCA|nr:hypothetical protein DFR70_12217 [Nocardia tenerifensis]